MNRYYTKNVAQRLTNNKKQKMINPPSVLIPESEIQQRVRELGAQLSVDYTGEELVLLGVLRGAVVFYADLARAIALPLRFEFLQLASYYDDMEPSQVQLIRGGSDYLEGRHILIVEDIVDTGHTLKFLIEHLLLFNPKTVKVCTLLDKPSRREVSVNVDYFGFEIPNAFVVGYGLDYAQKYRNLPYIGVLEPAD